MRKASGSDPGISRTQITGVILAGGRALRMGGIDKGLLELNEKPMIAYILAALRPQVGTVFINANRNAQRYASFGCPVLPDQLGDYFGPLAGMASAMQAANTNYVLSVPCDSPLLAADLAARLSRAMVENAADISVADDGERLQPVFALLRTNLLPNLLDYLKTDERKIDRWYARHKLARADFSDRPDTFINVNTPEERTRLEARLRGKL
jgi:molybdopterin-guanine dinucleotide biosynthesis protein A, proteobacterial